MTLLDAGLLGALQGLTEFLPVSSSGHLILLEKFLHLPVEDLKSFDIAVHFGTLLALLVYFWKEIFGLLQAFFLTPWLYVMQRGKPHYSEDLKRKQNFLGTLILASLPAILIGVTLGDWIDEHFRNPVSVSFFLILVGILFFGAEYVFQKVQKRPLGIIQGVLMGFAQCLALVPGVSRSGITISAGLCQGVKREQAARFSFLLGSVAIFGGTVFAAVAILKGKYALPGLDILAVGILSSFLVGLATVTLLMRFLKKHTLFAFGVYRIVLGATLLRFLINSL